MRVNNQIDTGIKVYYSRATRFWRLAVFDEVYRFRHKEFRKRQKRL